MKLLSLILVFAITTPALSFATAQDPEFARCKALREVRLEQVKWAVAYDEFKNDETLTFEDRYIVTYKGAQKIVRLIEEMRSLSDLQGRDELLSDAHKLFTAIENNEITKRSALYVLTRGLANLREKMDDVTYRAETKTDCEISLRSVGINPNSKPIEIDALRAGTK